MVKDRYSKNKKITGLVVLICSLILVGVLLSLSFSRRAFGIAKSSFPDMVYQNYEQLRSNTDNTIETISNNDLTLKVYDVFLEDHETVLKYELMKNGNVISKQSIYSLVISDNNQSIAYMTEYQGKNLAVLRDDNLVTIPSFEENKVKIVITIYYKLEKDGQSLSQDFEFNYAPNKLYHEKIYDINHEFSYLSKQIKINRIIFNGLYMLLECNYDYNTLSDVWYTFEAEDENGKKIKCYTASIGEGSSKYYLDLISEKEKVIYLSPIAHKYNAKKKEVTIPINEKIEVKIP